MSIYLWDIKNNYLKNVKNYSRSRFSAIWILLFSLVNQTVFVVLPGRQPVEFHFCAGTHPYEVSNHKFNFPVFGVYLFTFLANILIPLIIRCHQGKPTAINCLESQNSLYNLKSSSTVVFCLGASLSFMFLSYRIDLTKLNEPKHHFPALFSQLISPHLTPLLGSTGYLVTHRVMRSWLWQGIYDQYLNFNCFKINW